MRAPAKQKVLRARSWEMSTSTGSRTCTRNSPAIDGAGAPRCSKTSCRKCKFITLIVVTLDRKGITIRNVDILPSQCANALMNGLDEIMSHDRNSATTSRSSSAWFVSNAFISTGTSTAAAETSGCWRLYILSAI